MNDLLLRYRLSTLLIRRKCGARHDQEQQIRARANGRMVIYFTAPTVNPSMNRSRNRLYRIPIGRLVIRQAAISEPQ